MLAPVLTAWVALSGCSVDPDVPERFENDRRSRRRARRARRATRDAAPEPTPPLADLVDPEAPDVVLVVLDTVRADHTSLCGYARPTTPFLERLVSDFGARHTCEAYAPASWTLPTHAAWFTGVPLPEHHYDGLQAPDWTERETLADHFAAQGYDTLLITANPVLTRAEGLAKGFRHVRSASEIDAWRGDDVVEQLRSGLAGIEASRPLFLVVNIMDAHDPWGPIPEGLSWVPARPRLELHVKDREQPHPYHRFLKGELTPAERTSFLAAIVDGYDHGIAQADEALREVLGTLERRGRRERGMRLVVGSDHGELLGEHGLLRHGGWLWEPLVKVPLLVLDTRPGATPELPEGPLSAVHVHDLLRDGALPSPLRDVVAYESASNFPENPGSNTVALWSTSGSPRSKLLWTRDGEDTRTVRFDLAADPGEASPIPAPEGPALERLREHVEGYESHVRWRGEQQAASAEQRAGLEALGYVEQAAR